MVSCTKLISDSKPAYMVWKTASRFFVVTFVTLLEIMVPMFRVRHLICGRVGTSDTLTCA